MTYTSTFLNIEWTVDKPAEKANKDYHLIVELKLKKLISSLFHVFFVGPELKRKIAPGSYQSISREPISATSLSRASFISNQ